MPNLRTSVLEFENAFVIFEISALGSFLFQSLKKKVFKFGIKKVLFGYFWTGISKQYCHI